MKPYYLKYIKEWYSKSEVIELLLEDVADREAMVMDARGRVKRPIILVNEGDVGVYVNEGFLEFHRTTEKFDDYPEFKNRTGYDIIVDIDAPADLILNQQGYFRKSAINAVGKAALAVISILENFGIRNYGIKFSGGKGFHIRLSIEKDAELFGTSLIEGYELFAKATLMFIDVMYKSVVKTLFPNLSAEEWGVIQKTNIDIQLASPRHMIRAAGSVNLKYDIPRVSVPISREMLENPASYVNIFRVDKILESNFEIVKDWWLVKEDENVLKLIKTATLWYLYTSATERALKEMEVREVIKKLRKGGRKYRKGTPVEIDESKLLPPCIKNILDGLEDGRKRAVFILINFFAQIGEPWDKILARLLEWNQRNKEPLKERYIEYQVEWHKSVYEKGRKYLPPNCDNPNYYKDMVSVNGPVCQADPELCPLIKNPLSYYIRKLQLLGIARRKNNKAREDKKEEEIPEDLV